MVGVCMEGVAAASVRKSSLNRFSVAILLMISAWCYTMGGRSAVYSETVVASSDLAVGQSGRGAYEKAQDVA